MVVTVSQKKPESLSFFLKNGFVIKENIVGKYDDDIAEFVLVKDLESSKDLRMKSKYLKMIMDGRKTLECRANHKYVRSLQDITAENKQFYPDKKIKRVGGVSVFDFDIVK